MQIGSGLAFAFFAGDCYVFTGAEFDNSSEVTPMDYDDSDMNGKQDLTKVYNDAPLRILGWGCRRACRSLRSERGAGRAQ